uniref:Ovule protein n=1 Tax=Echinococcus granulosus TaxID=6210 RepID=A0A068WSS1_ECHGR|nr:hypothetical protein EgrG_001142900 [Echinococcus granulosus]
MNCEVIARDDKCDDYFGQSHVSCKEVILRKSESFSPPSPTSTDPSICLTFHLLSMHSVRIYLSLPPSTTHPAHIHPLVHSSACRVSKHCLSVHPISIYPPILPFYSILHLLFTH